MPILFHILDVSARDEKITSTTITKKPEQSYEPDDLDEDEEFKPSKKAWNNKTYQKADHSGKTYLVHLFGRTVEGHSIRCDIKGFQPFFYIKAPEGGVTIQRKAIGAIRSYIGRHIQAPDVLSKIQVTSCQRKELFGFTQNKAIPMIKLIMPSKAVFHEVKNLFLNTFSEPELKPLYGKADSLGDPFGNTVPIVYEANLDPMLRFLHLRNLQPCNWATIENLDSEDLSLEDSNVLECDWEDIQPCTTPPAPTAPFRLVSWDIECISNSGEFPMPEKGDPIIQIGAILGTLGSKETVKHIFVLGTCTQIPEGIVHVYKTEKALLLGFFQWIADESIDIFMGYNIFGFDEQYAWKRCVQLGIQESYEIQQLNRLHDDTKKYWELETKRLSSSAMGDNFLYLWNTPGRLRVDLYHYIKRGYPLSSYKLDDTSRYFLGESVKSVLEKVDAWELTVGPSNQDVAKGRSVVLLNAGGDTLCEKLDVLEYESGRIVVSLPEDVLADEVASWAIVKDDVSPKEMFALHKQGPDERAIIARYCVQDCQLVLDLFRKLDVFNNAMSMANVCSVPVPYIFLRGQGVKIESLMFKYCYEREQCIKVLTTNHADFESYEGAIVLDPTPGFYTVPVGVADFASLYPSTIISENISHDTLVWVKDYDDKGKQIPVLNKEGDFVRWNVYGSDDYDNLEGMRYTDITYDVMREDPEDTRKVKRTFKAGVRVCRYAQDKIGTIPQIVAGLLAARKAKRKEGASETDPFKKALLDAEQLAYKLTANSLYGQLGSGTFKVRLKALAASVTAYGRKQIMFSKAAIEQFYGPKSGNPRSAAQIVYGDTDSLFIAFHPKNPETGKPLEGKEAVQATIALTEEAGKFVSKMLKAPHDFEFDKVYWPFIIFSKKRYVGHKYEDGPDKYKLAFMGIALKRRDYAAIVKRMYAGALNILLQDRDVPKAAAFVQQMAVDLVEGRFGLQPLTISKSLRAEYNSVPAHKMLADRMAERDPGNKPASGDRIPYIYVQSATGQQAPTLQGERIETPSYIKEKGLKPDYMFYIDHQISNPLCQLFGVVVEQIPGFDRYPPPKGGWCTTMPEALIVQRETAAYELLFREAINVNNKGKKSAFAKLLGCKEPVKSVSSQQGSIQTRSQLAAAFGAANNQTSAANNQTSPNKPKQMSILDSMFAATVKLEASKEATKIVKEHSKESSQKKSKK
jgi:DNA polymerase elongation subunit (family B)